MRQLHSTMMMAIFAVAAIAGIIGTVAVVFLTTTAESASAWHSQFQSKKECTNFRKTVIGNTTAEANVMCQKIVPH
jgi:hypothetical protein